jgi:hypothetical protein
MSHDVSSVHEQEQSTATVWRQLNSPTMYLMKDSTQMRCLGGKTGNL